MSNYPPGVTGNEYQIAGPDYEEEREDISCPNGHSPCFVVGYRYERWGYCLEPSCNYWLELDNVGSNSFDILPEEPEEWE